ncbi:MAG: DUF5916 domain-containing protein [Longimicrobiales bacterium]
MRAPMRALARTFALAFTLALVLGPAGPSAAQSPAAEPPAPESPGTIEAVPVEAAALRLDGRLDEEVWRRATPATGLVQREPAQGEPAPDATEVRFAYDDDALWIGARMHSTAPDSIQAPVTRRDNEGVAEQLIVSLDTHLDRRTAYTFAVTPAGVRIDYYHGADFEGRRDYGYDPVWQAATAIDSLGWTAEIRIPFTQLRFPDRERQVWGVNLVRRVPARNEASYWVLVRRDETGWSSRMGQLTGIAGIRPSRRVELLPYVALDATMTGEIEAANPFAQEHETGVRAGGDLKMGVGPNLTLDATFNPDFGQVEADPAEVNLTAYETFFAERRPFFTEGAELFGGRGLFYSRRIGAPPPVEPSADFFQTVDNTTILGAAKLTGRLPSGLSVATLGAVTGREVVATYDADADVFGRAVVAPLTGYAVASVQQEFGPDASTLSGMLTAVERDIDGDDPLAGFVTRRAYSGMLESRLRWAGGKYDASAYIGFTHVAGDSAAILRLQRSSRRFYQRPDAGHVEVDPSRTSLFGTTMGINHSKMAGEHWLWDVDYFSESPGLEPNDIGRLGAADDRGLLGDIRYRETDPGRWARNWSLGVFGLTEWNHDGVRNISVVSPFFDTTLPNFWRFSLNGNFVPRGLSDALTRGGPLMGTGQAWGMSTELQNSSGSRSRWGFEAGGSRDELGGWSYRVEGDFSFRPGDRWEVTLDPRWIRREDARQFVLARDGGGAETFGRRYVFAHVDRGEVAARLRLNYTFTPNLTLETYAEPFASSGVFHSFGELEAARSRDLREYGTAGTTIERNDDGSRTVTADGETFTMRDLDFNVRSFRSNLVLRWEWRPGSTAFLVWQQNRFADLGDGRVAPADVFDTLRSGGDQFLALKVSYWIPVR